MKIFVHVFFEFGRIFCAATAQKTGLSACIFFACGKKGYRFYPLRGSNCVAV
jgi:hypothetical protein